MDIVVGGGKYGLEAVEYLMKHQRDFVVVDVDEDCMVQQKYGFGVIDAGIKPAKGRLFVRGGIGEVLKLVEELKPEYVFPTAPIHIAAALLTEKYGFEPWNEGVDCILPGLPAKIVVSVTRGSIIVSYNRDGDCLPKCRAPDVCPVTGAKKPAPMYELLRFAAPDGFIIQSHYLEPGLGALKGEDVLNLLIWASERQEAVVGTACRCHGVVTALKR
jgi:hypothetical protein